MPFIFAKLNFSLSEEQEVQLKRGLGKAIELIPGKSEKSLLVGLESGHRLFLQGDGSAPLAYITVSVFANSGNKGYKELSFAICELFQSILSIDPRRIYIKYDDIFCWSVSGNTFEVSGGTAV